MIPKGTSTETIILELLLDRVGRLRGDGWRLCAISSARLGDKLELLYSFDKDYQLMNLRLELSEADLRVPSISKHYFCAVLYENEMHDLFGLQVSDMAVDFKGNLYRTAVKYPFGSTKPPVVGTTTGTSRTSGVAPRQTTTATDKS